MIRVGRRQLKESVATDLKINKNLFAPRVLDRKCLAKAHGLCIEVHRLFNILDAYSEVIQPQAYHFFSLRGTRLHDENPNDHSHNKKQETKHRTHVSLPETPQFHPIKTLHPEIHQPREIAKELLQRKVR